MTRLQDSAFLDRCPHAAHLLDMFLEQEYIDPRMKVIGLVVILAALGFALISGCGGSMGSSGSQYSESILRMQKLANGVAGYATDYDDTFPRPNSWVDVTTPYVKELSAYDSPAVGKYGYALNLAIEGKSTNAFDPSTTVLTFDSTEIKRNADADVSTMPEPGRYQGRNTIGMADGYVVDSELVTDPLTEARRRIKAIALGALMYASDYDDVLPTANWVDETMPYVRSEHPFISPAFEGQPGKYGFAYNELIVGDPMSAISSPASTELYFDSTVLSRNAVASTSTMPVPGRYAGTNVISFVDGHVTP
jgi:hypothetical protein